MTLPNKYLLCFSSVYYSLCLRFSLKTKKYIITVHSQTQNISLGDIIGNNKALMVRYYYFVVLFKGAQLSG